MIDWGKYKGLLMSLMDGIKNGPPTTQPIAWAKIANGIVDGYLDALATGGDPILKAKVVILPTNIPVAVGILMAGQASLSRDGYMAAINMFATTLWLGATLNAAPCAPLRGHVKHAPVSVVLPTGVMAFVPPVHTDKISPPSHEELVDNIITALRAHAAGMSGIHPLMILPSPAPPYPLPWMGYV